MNVDKIKELIEDIQYHVNRIEDKVDAVENQGDITIDEVDFPSSISDVRENIQGVLDEINRDEYKEKAIEKCDEYLSTSDKEEAFKDVSILKSMLEKDIKIPEEVTKGNIGGEPVFNIDDCKEMLDSSIEDYASKNEFVQNEKLYREIDKIGYSIFGKAEIILKNGCTIEEACDITETTNATLEFSRINDNTFVVQVDSGDYDGEYYEDKYIAKTHEIKNILDKLEVASDRMDIMGGGLESKIDDIESKSVHIVETIKEATTDGNENNILSIYTDIKSEIKDEHEKMERISNMDKYYVTHARTKIEGALAKYEADAKEAVLEYDKENFPAIEEVVGQIESAEGEEKELIIEIYKERAENLENDSSDNDEVITNAESVLAYIDVIQEEQIDNEIDKEIDNIDDNKDKTDNDNDVDNDNDLDNDDSCGIKWAISKDSDNEIDRNNPPEIDDGIDDDDNDW